MDAPSYSFNHVCIPPQTQISLHTQESWELSHIVTGSGRHIIGGKTEPFSSGEVVMIPPGVPHCWKFSDKDTDRNGYIENITVTVEDVFLDQLAEMLPPLADDLDRFRRIQDCVYFKSGTARKIGGLLRRMKSGNEAARAILMVRLIYALCRSMDSAGSRDILFEPYDRPDQAELRLEKIRAYIACRYRHGISIDEISGHVGMNRSAFCVFFRRKTGLTFTEYLNSYRINIACKMLRHKGCSVSEACYESGVNDTAYASRVFRRYKGCSPSSFLNK